MRAGDLLHAKTASPAAGTPVASAGVGVVLVLCCCVDALAEPARGARAAGGCATVLGRCDAAGRRTLRPVGM